MTQVCKTCERNLPVELFRQPSGHRYRACRECRRKRLHPLYELWAGMIQRCENPNHVAWARYGGAGVTVCPEWRHSFQQFVEDVGPRPSKKHSLDRIDSQRPYEKANCRWATASEQALNRPHFAHMITAFGRTRHMSEWAKDLGAKDALIFKRLARGWSAEDAVSKPSAARQRQK